jgi:hypothetical protein
MWWPATATSDRAGSGRGRRQIGLGPAVVPMQGKGHRRVGLRPTPTPSQDTGPGEGWHDTETDGGVAIAGTEMTAAGQPHWVERCRLVLRPTRGGLGRRWQCRRAVGWRTMKGSGATRRVEIEEVTIVGGAGERNRAPGMNFLNSSGPIIHSSVNRWMYCPIIVG